MQVDRTQHLRLAAEACRAGVKVAVIPSRIGPLRSTPAKLKHPARGLLIAVVVLITGLSHASRQLLAQGVIDEAAVSAENQTNSAYQVSGWVVDAQRQPIRGASVLSKTYTMAGKHVTVTAETNDRGQFTLDYPDEPFRQHELFHVWAHAPGHALRVVMLGQHLRTSRRAVDVEISLPKDETVTFDIELPDGEPCVGAVVRPYYIATPNGTFAADEPTGLLGHLPADWLPRFAAKTDADGRAELRGIPSLLLNSVVVEAAGFGRQRFAIVDRLQLSEVGQLRGHIVSDNPGRYAGTMVHLRTEHKLRPQTWRDYGRGIAEVAVDQHGEFDVAAIAIGTVRLDLAWDDDADEYPIIGDIPRLDAGETLDIAIDVQPLLTMTGRVLTEDTGQAVVGASVSLRRTGSPTPRHVKTDADGRYTARLPAGSIRRQVYTMGTNSEIGKTYDYPSIEDVQVSSDVERVEFEPIRLKPQRVVKGTVRLAAGQPLSNVTVVIHSGSFRHLNGHAVSGDDGTFEMRVRRWEALMGRLANPLANGGPLRHQAHWAIMERPAAGASPPVFTPLAVIDDDPDALMLELP